ncbi:sensor histidine kinase [Yinghuangia sp. ASG 101]|uniref:sensor histidine kinase n=1 Tax=Yinghuangia sp. ASG 101 TaxID=2896848 RepID=UPI001E2864EE|nr:sensor histidine kinase [Yinghuangia sp. ASG 101]UGQ12014.1 sensor histidine kinase [Yinghuangia sp. ASG 101]
MNRPRFPFAAQVLALQLALVVVVAGVGFGLISRLLDRQLTSQYEQRALSVARSVASDPALAPQVVADDPEGAVRARAEAARRATGALFVVITDERGIRLAHPNPDLVGQRVSTDPSAALAGREVANIEVGTLGISARGKVPIRAADNTVVGEVSVGFDADDLRRHGAQVMHVVAAYSAGACLLGVVGSVLLARRMRRQTLGLEPHELAELMQEHEAVLHGIGEGVLAVDGHGTVTVCNDEAHRLLGLDDAIGRRLDDLDLPAGLRGAMRESGDSGHVLSVVGDRVVVAAARDVRRERRDLGRVLTVRDRTDLEHVTRELDAVRGLTHALRAQRHEFANRLHTLSGLLQLGHTDEAVQYLQALTEGAGTAPQPDGLRDPFLRSFMAAKAAVALEHGVHLAVGDASWVPGTVRSPVEVTTVLGNLVDNALEAARLGFGQPPAVEVELLADGADLHISVVDSGEGVDSARREAIFREGVSSRAEGGRGLGLPIAVQAARGTGGEVRLADPGGGDHGAVFTAHLRGVLAAPEPARTAAGPTTECGPTRESSPS